MIKVSDLRRLPFGTLAAFAAALARDVDAGQDKRSILEVVFAAIKDAK
jgi:hypothetical protein